MEKVIAVDTAQLERERSPTSPLEDASTVVERPQLEKLPAELLLNIMQHVPHDEVVRNLRLVNKCMQREIVDPAIFRTWCERCSRERRREDFARFDFLEGIPGSDRENPPWRQPTRCLECGRRPLETLNKGDRYQMGQSFLHSSGKVFVRCEDCREVAMQYVGLWFFRKHSMPGLPNECHACSIWGDWRSDDDDDDGDSSNDGGDGGEGDSSDNSDRSDSDDDGDSGDVSDAQSPSPTPPPQPLAAPLTLDSLPPEVIWSIASYLPNTSAVDALKGVSKHTRTWINAKRNRTYCLQCNEQKSQDAFSRFDMRFGISVDEAGMLRNRSRPEFGIECGRKKRAEQGVFWDRYLPQQGYQDFEGRMFIRCRRCEEMKCVHEGGKKDDEYWQQRHVKLCRECWECWAEFGEDSDSVHSSDLEAAGIDVDSDGMAQ